MVYCSALGVVVGISATAKAKGTVEAVEPMETVEAVEAVEAVGAGDTRRAGEVM